MQLNLSINSLYVCNIIEKKTRYKTDNLPRKIFIYILLFGYLTLLFKNRIYEYRKNYDLYEYYIHLKSMKSIKDMFLDNNEHSEYKRLDRYFKLKQMKFKK